LDRAAKTALVSVVIGLVVLGLKYLAYHLTGSIALYSDALESVVNVVAAAAALLALRVSAQPADANHPYGHHKAEYFSAVLEGVLIVLAALSILRAAWLGYHDPRPLDAPALGLAVNAVASAVNGVWSWFLISRGRRWRSPALVADGHHLRADVVTSVGVLAGVGLVALTGWLVLDPLLAALVALNILWSGWRMVRESVGGLMDEAASPDVLARIRALIAEYAEGALEAHDLRTRHAGRKTFIDFHLVVPADMRVAEAHEICDRIEAALKQDVEGAVIIIHVEPEEKAKHKGVVVL
jgi:cation diffusion facilitator family transporter